MPRTARFMLDLAMPFRYLRLPSVPARNFFVASSVRPIYLSRKRALWFTRLIRGNTFADLHRSLTMRRTLLLVPILGVAAVVAALAVRPATSPAEGAKTETTAKVPSPNLPIAQAVLFSSGV